MAILEQVHDAATDTPEGDHRPRRYAQAFVLIELVLAVVVAAVVAAVGLEAFGKVHWPAFNSSNETHAVTTVGQVCCLALLAAAIAIVRRTGLTVPARLLSWVGLSGLVSVTLGMPLAATKLYLLGITVDQEFRTEYLTRLTDSAALHDMTYPGLPPYYPAGWFWVGGRVAHLLGIPGWEVFKPYAITVIAVAAVVGLVLWSKLIRADLAIAAATACTAVIVAYDAPEAYGAPIAMLIAPVLLLAWGGLYRPDLASLGLGRRRGWAALVGTGLFLGAAATFYTLFCAIAAAAVTVMALVAAGLRAKAKRRWRAGIPVLARLAVAAVTAGLVALLVWGPYLAGLRSHRMAQSGTAFQYLPESGALLQFPMLWFSPMGWLCFIGTVWVLICAHRSRSAQALGLGVVTIYLWSLLSMVSTVARTTLLSFRLTPILISLLLVAGVFGFVEATRALYRRIGSPTAFRTTVAVVAAIGAIGFCQNIPHVLAHEITIAYTDTDGDGIRADRRDPSAVSNYREIDRDITALRRRPRHDTVVLTGDFSFLSYYPYYAFQAHTSHYANPMADFAGRAAAIDHWSELRAPEQLIDALDHCHWRPPDVFLLRKAGDNYSLTLSEDVYPNDPNVKDYTVTFNHALFDNAHWTIRKIGPFVLVVRR